MKTTLLALALLSSAVSAAEFDIAIGPTFLTSGEEYQLLESPAIAGNLEFRQALPDWWKIRNSYVYVRHTGNPFDTDRGLNQAGFGITLGKDGCKP